MAEIGRNINLAYSKGQDAHDAKWTLADNPYKKGSPSWRGWRAGWCAEFQAAAKATREDLKRRVETDKREDLKWKDTRYPGDHVHSILLRNGKELGSITIQDYMECSKARYRVGTFLPGIVECSPGDTPKTWPEKSEYLDSVDEADELFDTYLNEALVDGWSVYRERGAY